MHTMHTCIRDMPTVNLEIHDDCDGWGGWGGNEPKRTSFVGPKESCEIPNTRQLCRAAGSTAALQTHCWSKSGKYTGPWF